MGMRSVGTRGILAVLALSVVGTVCEGCRHFSRDLDADAANQREVPDSLPAPKPIADEIEWSEGNKEVRKVIEEVLRGEGLIGDTGGDEAITLQMRVRHNAGEISVVIDVLNFLTAFLIPKIRAHELSLSASLRAGQKAASVTTNRKGYMTSWELWLPYVFFPPAWPGVVKHWGGDVALEIAADIGRQAAADLVFKDAEVGGVGATTEELERCPYCDEPRDADPCPHCGIE